MFDYYFATIFFSVFIMLIMKLMLHGDEIIEEKHKKKLNIITTLVIIAAISEWLGVYLDGKPTWLIPIHIDVKILELSIAPVILVLCADMIGEIRSWKVMGIILGIHAILETSSGFFGFIFSVDDKNYYHHEKFYWIYVTSFVAGIILFIVKVIKASSFEYGTRRVIMLMLSIFVVLGLVVQYVGETVRVIYLCTSIAILVMYILYMEVSQNTDALTHLLNRRYYESRISRIFKPAIIFYFDINDFKMVNDTYGHSFGDYAISKIGKCIMEVYGKKGYCYRIGGDEFCVIMYAPFEEAKIFNTLFETKIFEMQNEDSRLPKASVGYAFYDPSKDNIADVVKVADSMMYHRKRMQKQN